MAHQQESKIEDFAFDYLKKYYIQQYAASNILAGQAEKTRKGHAADGMLAFKREAGDIFVANISMRQSEGLAVLLTNYRKNGLGKLRFITPLVMAALCFMIGKSTGNVLVMLVLPVVAAPLMFMLHTYLYKSLLIRRVKHLVENVKHLPANEQWIGLSISSLVFRNNQLSKIFMEMCRTKGIGLITVGKRSKVVLMQRPGTTTSRRGDFLSHYQSDANIRRALNDDHVLRVA